MSQVQKAKVVQVFDHDLKEAISDVKKDWYRKVLKEVHDSVALAAVEHEIRTDPQLTRDDRLQILGDVGHAANAIDRNWRVGIHGP